MSLFSSSLTSMFDELEPYWREEIINRLSKGQVSFLPAAIR